MELLKSWLALLLFLALGILIGWQVDNPFATAAPQPGPQSKAEAEPAATANQARPASQDDAIDALDPDYLEQVLANVDAGRRQEILGDPALFRRFVEQEALNRSLKAAAYANDLHENAQISFLMARAGDNVLREIYINRLMQEQLPADFPTAAQIRQFYEQNPGQFETGERVQVWQVFLPVTADSDTQQASATAEQAEALLQQIRAGKLSFAEAARQHSAHEASRQNDGFMGAVQAGDLKPVIAEALNGLEQDKLGLVRSEDGWHLLKKGRALPSEQLPFDKVQPQVRRLLVEQSRRQFRQAVEQRAAESYPYMPADEELRQWRQSLQASVEAAVSGRQ